MRTQIVFCIVDQVAHNVCHVFFGNSKMFAKRVFDDFFKRAEVPEERKKDFALCETSVKFDLPETYDEFSDLTVYSFDYGDNDRPVDKVPDIMEDE